MSIPPPPHFKIIRPLLAFPHFLNPPSATLSKNWSFQVFHINRNATVKLSLINTIHTKQKQNVGFFIFKFTLNYMLGNVYINKIHARQCLHVIKLYCRNVFPILAIFLPYQKESFTSNFKTARKKRFFHGAT